MTDPDERDPAVPLFRAKFLDHVRRIERVRDLAETTTWDDLEGSPIGRPRIPQKLTDIQAALRAIYDSLTPSQRFALSQVARHGTAHRKQSLYALERRGLVACTGLDDEQWLLTTEGQALWRVCNIKEAKA